MEEPRENLSPGFVAAATDAQQGVKNYGQPAGRGHKLRASLKGKDSHIYTRISCSVIQRFICGTLI